MRNNTLSNSEQFLSIDLTKKCTNNCIFCVVEGRNDIAKDQDIDEIRTFLLYYKEKGYNLVNLHGGEPTIYKDLNKLIKTINELGFKKIVIQTNGVKLTDEQFVKNLLSQNVELFVVSIHDCIPEWHNKVTKSSNSFQIATEGIKNVLKLGGLIRVNTVLLKSNYKRICDIIDYLYYIGVRTFNISSLNPYWITFKKEFNLFEELTPSYKELEPYIQATLDKYEDIDVKITLEGFPYCFLSDYGNYNLYNTVREIILLSDFEQSIINYEEFLNHSGIRVKRRECVSCQRYTTCQGVWSGYTKVRGWEEFQPINNHK